MNWALLPLVAPLWAQESPIEPGARVPEPEVVAPEPVVPLVVPWPGGVVATREAEPVVVELMLTIDAQGVVTGATPAVAADPFVEHAVAVSRTFRFRPAMIDGVPLAVEVPFTAILEPPPVNVEGVVRVEGRDLAPTPGLVVQLGDRQDTTREDGSFAFRGVAPGEVTLTVDLPPELTLAPQVLQVVEGESTRLELYARAPEAEKGIFAIYRIQRDEIVRRTLTAEELRTTPGTMGDPLRAISNLPGAVRTPLDSGWLLVRGGNPRDTGVYIDGIRAPLIYHLGGFTSVVHPGFIERVDFFPGGQSARYGRSTAGVVDLVTRPRPEELDVRAGANIVLAGAFTAVGTPKGGVSVGFRRSYLDAVLASLPGLTEEQSQVAPRFWDWQVRGDVGPFTAFGLGYIDTIDASTSEGEQLAVTVNTQRVQGTWATELLDKDLRVQPAFAWELRRFTIEALNQTQDRLVVGPMLRAEWVDDGTGDWGWSAGVDATLEQYLLRYNSIDRTALVGSPEAYGDVRLGHDLRTVLGLRLDTLFPSGQEARLAASPRLSTSVPISDRLTLVGDFGVYHQPPSYDLLFGPPEGAILALERSWGGGAGARIEQGPVRVDFDGYVRRVENLTGYESDGSLNQGQGLAWGLETLTRYSEGRLSGWLTLSYTRSLRRDSAALGWRPALYDQPLSTVLVGAWDLGRDWTLAGRWRYASGYPVPEVDSDTELEAYDVLRQLSVPLVGNERDRLPAFHALDLKFSKRIPGDRWRMEAYLDVQNVYWRRIPEPVITGFEELFQLYAYGFGLPTLPILGIEGSFHGGRRTVRDDATPAR